MWGICWQGWSWLASRLGWRAQSSTAKRAILLAPVVAFIGIWPLLAPTDPDYWLHQTTGRLIDQTHSVPRTDPYSSTAYGQPWIAHEWLTELVFATVQAHAGFVANA